MRADTTAVIWDFDGTLVDTRAKNLNVTRALVELVHDRGASTFAALASLVDYERALHAHASWKDFYRLELEMTDEQVLTAGSRWLEFQLADDTEADPYEGIPDVLEHLSDLPHGIVSLNARDNILRFLEHHGIVHHFDEVLGHEAVEAGRQKPAPDALLLCIERLTEFRPGRVLYVGDHETDTQCAHAASEWFRQQEVAIDVIAVGAFYGNEADDSGWPVRPHVRALDPRHVLDAVGAATDRGILA